MAAETAVTRDDLFRTLAEQWQKTEDAIAAVGDRFDRAAHGGWTVGDVFRHITSTTHDASADVRAMIATGSFPIPADDDAANAAGIARFAALDHKMLRIELNTAHGVVWMYVQRFSDEDLARSYDLAGTSFTLGETLGLLAQHEGQHVADALAAAGLSDDAVVPVETAHRWA